jgi:glycosyltransferase involved in cell wall biosynthesis
MAQADVVVDQVFMGWYGMVAVEAMALGRPALCYIRPDFEQRLIDDPIVRITKETLTADLERVLTDADRESLAQRGRAFVERENAAPVIARRLADTYARLTGAAAGAPDA